MGAKASVLIVDDNPVHLELYRMIVEQAGFRGIPLLVSFGGMEFPLGDPVDAVLLDYRLGPDISGINAVKQVRERYPQVPILILSDQYDPPSDAVPYIQGFVRKGNPEDLLSALRQMLSEPPQS
jgi:DNA-binding response OmpR family regulator